jgi:hypothetical protein
MRTALLLVLVLSTAACGGSDNGSPTGPSPFVANFGGVWVGTWQRQGCTETGGAVGACSALPTSGGLRLSLTQAGSDVQGTVEIGTVVTNVTGTITSNTLSLTGNGRFESFAVTVSNWSTRVSGATMSGTFSFTLIPDDTSGGTVIIQASLQNVGK